MFCIYTSSTLSCVFFLQERKVLVVPGLQLASAYRLEVGVITAGGQGPTTFKTFQTPGHARPVLHYSKGLI